MVIMVQKEVAQNIVAQPGDLSLLAISVSYGKPEIVGYVPARNFYLRQGRLGHLKVTVYPEPPLKVTAEKDFFKLSDSFAPAASKLPTL
jgi:16S rRNA (adenine1518-N6/adenine1519-N6)-dimethyltransferase